MVILHGKFRRERTFENSHQTQAGNRRDSSALADHRTQLHLPEIFFIFLLNTQTQTQTQTDTDTDTDTDTHTGMHYFPHTDRKRAISSVHRPQVC